MFSPSADGLFHGHDLLFSHPAPQEIHTIAAAVVELHVHPAVGTAHHNSGVMQHLSHGISVPIVRGMFG